MHTSEAAGVCVQPGSARTVKLSLDSQAWVPSPTLPGAQQILPFLVQRWRFSAQGELTARGSGSQLRKLCVFCDLLFLPEVRTMAKGVDTRHSSIEGRMSKRGQTPLPL